jgi:hypothetical protein
MKGQSMKVAEIDKLMMDKLKKLSVGCWVVYREGDGTKIGHVSGFRRNGLMHQVIMARTGYADKQVPLENVVGIRQSDGTVVEL